MCTKLKNTALKYYILLQTTDHYKRVSIFLTNDALHGLVVHVHFFHDVKPCGLTSLTCDDIPGTSDVTDCVDLNLSSAFLILFSSHILL